MSTSIGNDRESFTIKYEDYNSSTQVLSQDPNPKYTLSSLTKNKSNLLYLHQLCS